MYTSWESIDNAYKVRLISIYIDRRQNYIFANSIVYLAIMLILVIIIKFWFPVISFDTGYQSFISIIKIILIFLTTIYLYGKIRIYYPEMEFCAHYLEGYFNKYQDPILEQEEDDLEKFEECIYIEYDTRYRMFNKALIRSNLRDDNY